MQLFRLMWMTLIIASTLLSSAHATDPFSMGIGTNSISFYAIKLRTSNVDANAVIRDIVFYDESGPLMMDTRAQLDYTGQSVAYLLDGNPNTVMDASTGLDISEDAETILGFTATHMVVNTPDASRLDGITLEFMNIRRRGIHTVDLGDLAAQGSALAYQIDFPTGTITPLGSVPATAQYPEWDIASWFAPSARQYTFQTLSDLNDFVPRPNWVESADGVYAVFQRIYSSTAELNQSIHNSHDNNVNTKWAEWWKEPVHPWIAKLMDPVAINKYSMTSGNDVPDRDPKTWGFYGSNDGENWVELDRRVNQPQFPQRKQKIDFTFSNSTVYSFYKLELEEHYGNYLFQLAEVGLGDLDLTAAPVQATLELNSNSVLSPGESFAITLSTDYTETAALYQCGVRLGGHEFNIQAQEKLTDPNGDRFRVKREQGADDSKMSLVFTRGSGADSEVITWRILGIRNDCMGLATLSGLGSGDAALEFFTEPDVDGPETVFIDSLELGATDQALPSLPAALVWEDTPNPATVDTRAGRTTDGVTMPEIALDEKYGPLTASELAAFKAHMDIHLPVKSNNNNSLLFGGQQATLGLYRVLEASDDEALLATLEEWCDSVLEYRNGGPHYAVNFLPANVANPVVEARQIYPVWNHFWGPMYADGELHFSDDISAGSGGPATLLLYPQYIAAHPDQWNLPASTGGMTRLEKAKMFIQETELTLHEFSLKLFADPINGQIEKPWNRYAELIEACMMLENIYDDLQGEADIFDQGRKDEYNRVVRGWLNYFFSDESYSESVITVGGKPTTVMDYRYAPRYLGWGAYSEPMNYAGIDFAALSEAYSSGRYTDLFSDAQLMIIRNTLRHVTFQGYDGDGDLLLRKHIAAYAGQKSNWPTHMTVVSFVDPSFYDDFGDGILGAINQANSFGNILHLREMLEERGLGDPATRTTPEVEIVDTEPGNKITLSANVTDGSPVRYEWDFNKDGEPDYIGQTIEPALTDTGYSFVLLKAIDANGHAGFAQITLDVSSANVSAAPATSTAITTGPTASPQLIHVNEHINLNVQGQLTGIGELSTAWRRISGPGAVAFDDPTGADTVARFNAAGTYELEVAVRHGDSETTALLTVEVYPVGTGNIAPTAFNATAEVNANDAVAIPLSGSDLNGDPLTFAVTAEPTNGFLMGNAPDLTYVPHPGYSGTDEFFFTVSDGATTSPPATISITVHPVLNGTEVALNADVANSSPSGYGGSILNTLNDPFAYNPLAPTAALPQQYWSGSDGFHGTAPEGADVMLVYSVTNGPAALPSGGTFAVDLYGRDQLNDRCQDIDIELYSGGFGGSSVASVTAVAISESAPYHVHAELAPSAAFDTVIVIGHDSVASNGLNNFTLMEIRTTAVSTGESNRDSDNDGLTDVQEIALGTDPGDPESEFGIDGLPLPATEKIQITWPSATGVLYKVWESPDLSGWTVARDWTNALTPPEDTLEFDLSPSNGFFKVEAEIQ